MPSNEIRVKRFKIPELTSCTYLVWCDGFSSAYLIDGGAAYKAWQFSDSIGLEIHGIFLTHCHYDHIYQLNELTAIIPSVKIYGHRLALEGLASAKMNLSFYHEAPIEVSHNNCFELEGDKEALDVFSNDFPLVSYFFTPGHSLDSITYKIGNYLFTGDALIPGIETVTKLKGGNKRQAQVSEAAILALIDKNTVLCPGHGPMFTIFDLTTFSTSKQI